MHKNNANLCGNNAAEGTQFKAIFVLLVILLSGTALSLLLMIGEWLIHLGKRFLGQKLLGQETQENPNLNRVKNYGAGVIAPYKKIQLANFFDTAFSVNSLGDTSGHWKPPDTAVKESIHSANIS